MLDLDGPGGGARPSSIVIVSGRLSATATSTAIGSAAIERTAIPRSSSEEILRASNLGSPVTINCSVGLAGRAYREAARRLAGETVPMVIPDEKKTLLNRLLGRRAA